MASQTEAAEDKPQLKINTFKPEITSGLNVFRNKYPIEGLTNSIIPIIIQWMGSQKISIRVVKYSILLIILTATILGALIYFKSVGNPLRSPQLISIEKGEIPNILLGDDLIYKSPIKTKKVEVYYSGNQYVVGKKLKQSLPDRLYNTWRIPISEVKFSPGRHNFRFKIGENFEDFPERVVVIDDQGNWKSPPKETPIAVFPHKKSKTFRIKDNSATRIEIVLDQSRTIPLKYNKKSELWEGNNFDLSAGEYEYRVQKDGSIETNSNGLLKVDSKARFLPPETPWAELVVPQVASKSLYIKSPTVSALTLSGSFDNFATEHKLAKVGENFSIATSQFGLSEGVYKMTVQAPTDKTKKQDIAVYINKEGEVYTPPNDLLEILTEPNPTKTMRVIFPKNINTLEVVFSKDNWKKFNQLENNNGTWEITFDGKDKLSPGLHEFKLHPNSTREKGKPLAIVVEDDGSIYYPEKISPKIISVGNGKLIAKAPKHIILSIRNSKNWDIDIPGEYNNTNNYWEFDTNKLGIDTSQSQRYMFKFLVNGIFESGANRIIVTDTNGKVSIKNLESKPDEDPNIKNFTRIEDKIFGSIREVNPDRTYSLASMGNWPDDMVIYHIWVRAFRDSSTGAWAKDLTGDIRGIREAIRGNYFEDIGANALWLSPITSTKGEDIASPTMHGYDTLDFYNLNPNFGDIEEVKGLLKDAHSKGIRIILDIVPNHVSNMHPWFIASKDPNHPEHEKYKDYFIWTDKKIEEWSGKGFYGSSSQHFDKDRNQYYYAIFKPELPDLNYNNPQVVRELLNNLIYWLNLGIDGVRIDAIVHVFDGDPNLGPPQRNHPKNIDLFRRINILLDTYKELGFQKMILAENYSWNKKEIELYGKTKPNSSIRGADASLNFAFAEALQGAIKEGKTRNLKKHLKDLQPPNILYPRFISNHDNGYARAATNYGTEGAKLAYAINALSPGPYLIYYGEELAMRGSRNPPEELRKPVDWKEFSKQAQDPGSTLNFYKKIHKIRSNFKDELTWQSMKILEVRTEAGGEVSEDIVAILYEGEKKSLVTIYNLGRNNSAVTITLPQQLKDANTSYELEEILTIGEATSAQPEFSRQWDGKAPLIIRNLQPRNGIILKAKKTL